MNPSEKTRAIPAVCGPTASGKTALGVELALRFHGEIINCDSVQIYREISIATAKPSKEEMRGVPHHLLDYVDPRVNYTAADWAADASRLIVEIESRGKKPILVGGTGFYLRTLRAPLFDSPKTDLKLRSRFQDLHKNRGSEYLYGILKRVDPKSASRLFPRDYVRVIRALEVFFQTGERLSDRQVHRPSPPEFAARIVPFVLDPDRDQLYQLINSRAVGHFDSGLVDEVEKLRNAGVPDQSNALGSHGYRRVCEFLRGERTLESALEKTQQDVRNYAKRQLTWFRGEPESTWLRGFGTDPMIVREAIQHLVPNSQSDRLSP